MMPHACARIRKSASFLLAASSSARALSASLVLDAAEFAGEMQILGTNRVSGIGPGFAQDRFRRRRPPEKVTVLTAQRNK
ncbi:hypothetical protein MRB53_036960 [Persea americana]|nr:hypothetical protein MRB53_036960 [Persea americana]